MACESRPAGIVVLTKDKHIRYREVEIQALTAPQVRKRVAERGIQLISYREAAAPAQESEAAA